jgi:hypothetical protein
MDVQEILPSACPFGHRGTRHDVQVVDHRMCVEDHRHVAVPLLSPKGILPSGPDGLGLPRVCLAAIRDLGRSQAPECPGEPSPVFALSGSSGALERC